MIGIGHSLDKIIEHAIRLQQVRKEDLQYGDQVIVLTRNSRYTIRVLRNGQYEVSGGYFDRKGLSPIKITITGCTWGGRIIKLDIVAACGLHLEFGNRVLTTAIRKVFVIPSVSQN